MPASLDKFDLRILEMLQEDCSITTQELAEHVGLSQSPCWKRLQRLKEQGFIKKRVALVAARKIGLKSMVFVQVRVDQHDREHLDDFASAMMEIPEVVCCHAVLGAVDFVLQVMVRDLEQYQEIVYGRLSKLPNVNEISSMAVLSEVKATTALPLPEAGHL